MANYVVIVEHHAGGKSYPERAQANGLIPVIVLDKSKPSLFNDPSKAKEAKDFAGMKVFSYVGGDRSLFLNELKAFFQDKLGQVFVLPGTETGVELADFLSEGLCPAFSNGTALTAYRTQKDLMVRKLEEHNIPAPLTLKPNSLDEILKWVEKNGLLEAGRGVVIKPPQGAASVDVRACVSREDIENAFHASFDPFGDEPNILGNLNEAMVAQEFLHGIEYIVDTGTFAGQHTLLGVWRYKKTQVNEASFVYDSLDILDPDGKEREQINQLFDYTCQLLDGFGIEYGVAHIEVILTEDGPLLVETNMRPHGGQGHQLYRVATGKSQIDWILEAFANFVSKGSEIEPEEKNNKVGYALKQPVRTVHFISRTDTPMTQEDAKKLESIKNLPTCIHLDSYFQVGQLCSVTKDILTAGGQAWLSGTPEQIEEDYKFIRTLEENGLFNRNPQPSQAALLGKISTITPKQQDSREASLGNETINTLTLRRF